MAKRGKTGKRGGRRPSTASAPKSPSTHAGSAPLRYRDSQGRWRGPRGGFASAPSGRYRDRSNRLHEPSGAYVAPPKRRPPGPPVRLREEQWVDESGRFTRKATPLDVGEALAPLMGSNYYARVGHNKAGNLRIRIRAKRREATAGHLDVSTALARLPEGLLPALDVAGRVHILALVEDGATGGTVYSPASFADTADVSIAQAVNKSFEEWGKRYPSSTVIAIDIVIIPHRKT